MFSARSVADLEVADVVDQHDLRAVRVGRVNDFGTRRGQIVRRVLVKRDARFVFGVDQGQIVAHQVDMR